MVTIEHDGNTNWKITLVGCKNFGWPPAKLATSWKEPATTKLTARKAESPSASVGIAAADAPADNLVGHSDTGESFAEGLSNCQDLWIKIF